MPIWELAPKDSVWRYRFFSTPSNEQVYKKIFASVKNGAVFGLFAGILSIQGRLNPVAFRTGLNSIAYWTVRGGSAGAICSSVLCGTTFLRGKEDCLNYGAAGATAGYFFGAKHISQYVRGGAVSPAFAFFFGGFCLIYRYIYEAEGLDPMRSVNEKRNAHRLGINSYKSTFGAKDYDKLMSEVE